MYSLSVYRKYLPDQLPVRPGERLGEGNNGEVLSIEGDSSKVLKLSMLLTKEGDQSKYRPIKNGLDYMVAMCPPAYVRVYEHGYLGECPIGPSPCLRYIFYYYIMEKLHKTSEDERKLFHSILSHEDRGLKKRFSLEKIRKMLGGMAKGLDFDAEKVMLFCENIRAAPVIHEDTHGRNIMKNDNGNFRLIDLDSISLLKQEKEQCQAKLI